MRKDHNTDYIHTYCSGVEENFKLLETKELQFPAFKEIIKTLPEEPEIVQHNYFEELLEQKRRHELEFPSPPQSDSRQPRSESNPPGPRQHNSDSGDMFRSSSQRPQIDSRMVESQANLGQSAVRQANLDQSDGSPSRGAARLPVSHTPRSRQEASNSLSHIVGGESRQQIAIENSPLRFKRTESNIDLENIHIQPRETYEQTRKSLMDHISSHQDDSLDEDFDIPDTLVDLEGLKLDPRKAGYQDYIDYLAVMKAERDELRRSLSEVKDQLSFISETQSKNLGHLNEQLSSMSFNVDAD